MITDDLRRGNIVYKAYPDGNEECEVVNISQFFVNGFGASGIKPIPLTQERLVNFGFELKVDEGDMKYYELGKFGVKWVESDEFYFYLVLKQDYIILNELLHVHDLQNVWHSLTCSDLILKNIIE